MRPDSPQEKEELGQERPQEDRGVGEEAQRRSGVQRAVMPEDLHHAVPPPLCPAGPMSPGAACPTAPQQDGGVLLIPVQTGQGPATSTRAKTEPGGDMGASWDLPPAPAVGQDVEGGSRPVGLGAEPQGARSWCSCPRPRAEGRQWGRAGGRELLRHESPALCTAGAASLAALPRCLAGSRAVAAGGQAAWHRDQLRKRPPPTGPRSRVAQLRTPPPEQPRAGCSAPGTPGCHS